MTDLVERLRDVARGRYYENPYPDGYVDDLFIEDCEVIMEAADALERQQWVPCSERLPDVCSVSEYGNWVLVNNGYHTGVGALRDCEDGEPPQWLDEHNEWIEPKPILWMPLPEPPK